MTNLWQFVFFDSKSLPKTAKSLGTFYRNCLLQGLVPVTNVTTAPKELLQYFMDDVSQSQFTHYIILTNIENSNKDNEKTSPYKGLLYVARGA